MIAIDSSVLIDLLAGDDAAAEGAEASLRECLSAGPVAVCDVVLAEVKSRWCCVDATTLRPARIAEHIVEHFFGKREG